MWLDIVYRVKTAQQELCSTVVFSLWISSANARITSEHQNSYEIRQTCTEENADLLLVARETAPTRLL